MDAETDKWNSTTDENNDIVKRAKNMSAMAFSMYQFTKGEGSLRTTQDLFTQAEYFAEEANRLYKVVRQFSYQVGVECAVAFFSIKILLICCNRFQQDNRKRNCSIIWIKFQRMCKHFNLQLKNRLWGSQQRLLKLTMSYRKRKI